MSLNWGPATKASADKLAAAIQEYNADGKHNKLMARAAAGEFTDYSDAHACLIYVTYVAQWWLLIFLALPSRRPTVRA